MKNTFKYLAAALVLFALVQTTVQALAKEEWGTGTDRHAGYYYPKPQSEETYTSNLTPLPGSGKRTRIGFTVGLNAQQNKRGFRPGYHIFAKGADSQKIIIVATGDNEYNTLFRLRALMASLSAEARASPLFSKARSPESLNFLDLMKLIGVKRVTISDGATIAHQIDIK